MKMQNYNYAEQTYRIERNNNLLPQTILTDDI